MVSSTHSNLLILWDIDGTLLHSTGAGMKALHKAVGKVFGIEGTLDGIDFAGRTDRAIIRQILERFGLPHTPENVERLAMGYTSLLPDSLVANHSVILPGVERLLREAAAHPRVSQGLLTGNLRRGAQIKLGHHGLWEYFPVGAFADDSESRNDLGPHALERARRHWSRDFRPEHVWVIGDTPHDIACARAFGARALAVATGLSGTEALAAHRPDAVLADLSDADAFWRVLLGAI
jgi:phosphoglycolate phosphatase